MLTMQLPEPVLGGTGSLADWMQNTAGLVISRAVDAEFVRKTGINDDPTTWPGINEQGQDYAQGAPATGRAASLSMPLMLGAGVLAVGLLFFLLKD